MTCRPLFLLHALAAVGIAVAFKAGEYFDDAKVCRPVHFMENQTAGGATLAGQNPSHAAVRNPLVWQQYFAATAGLAASTHNMPNGWGYPTIGYRLRTLHQYRTFWLTFLPLLTSEPVVAIGYVVANLTCDRRKATSEGNEATCSRATMTTIKEAIPS